MNGNRYPDAVVDIRNVSFWYTTAYKIARFKLPFFKWKQTKNRQKQALIDVSFPIRKGRVTALLGQNGSGKTTLIKLISGARYLQQGEIRVFGTTPEKAKGEVGLCLGNTLIYHRLTGRENLEYYGKLFDAADLVNRIEEISRQLGLTQYLDQLVETYSFGTKAKLALARSLIHRPKLLILDEPTLGIDYGLSLSIRSFIKTMDCSILLTTHYMEEAEYLADDLCIINDGRILVYGTKEAILERYHTDKVAIAYSRAIAEAQGIDTPDADPLPPVPMTQNRPSISL